MVAVGSGYHGGAGNRGAVPAGVGEVSMTKQQRRIHSLDIVASPARFDLSDLTPAQWWESFDWDYENVSLRGCHICVGGKQ